MAQSKDKPVYEVRHGLLKAAIWRNKTAVGVRYRVTLVRLYIKDGTWRSTGSFEDDDLLEIGPVSEEAHAWIRQQPDYVPNARDRERASRPTTRDQENGSNRRSSNRS